jgi:hypothetical protein
MFNSKLLLNQELFLIKDNSLSLTTMTILQNITICIMCYFEINLMSLIIIDIELDMLFVL